MNNLTPEYKDKSPAFFRALEFTLNPTHEGAYANDKNDLGGETYCGIARKFHPTWDGWPIIDDAKEIYPYNPKDHQHFDYYLKTHEIAIKVQAFYQDNFWKALQLDKVNNERVAIKIFDMSVNLGVPHGASIVQTCLNLLNYKTNYELKVDNIIGSLTINLINEVTKNDDGALFLNLLTLSHGNIFMKSAQNNPTQKKYIHGWINRLNMTVSL